jgi:hypothetical protein
VNWLGELFAALLKILGVLGLRAEVRGRAKAEVQTATLEKANEQIQKFEKIQSENLSAADAYDELRDLARTGGGSNMSGVSSTERGGSE